LKAVHVENVPAWATVALGNSVGRQGIKRKLKMVDSE
jgi:hypothetical protein